MEQPFTVNINSLLEDQFGSKATTVFEISPLMNIPKLSEALHEAIEQGRLSNILNEIILQSKVEFNFVEKPGKAANESKGSFE